MHLRDDEKFAESERSFYDALAFMVIEITLQRSAPLSPAHKNDFHESFLIAP